MNPPFDMTVIHSLNDIGPLLEEEHREVLGSKGRGEIYPAPSPEVLALLDLPEDECVPPLTEHDLRL